MLLAQLTNKVLALTLVLEKPHHCGHAVRMSQASVTKPLNYFTICFNACFSLSGTEFKKKNACSSFGVHLVGQNSC